MSRYTCIRIAMVVLAAALAAVIVEAVLRLLPGGEPAAATVGPPRDGGETEVYAEYRVRPMTVGRADTETVEAVFKGHVYEDETVEPPELEYLGRYYVTGYDLCADCCGKTDGITASGAVAEVGRTAAMGVMGLEFGATLWIPGIGERVVEDRGNMGPRGIDVLCEDHAACAEITGWYDVWEVKE